MSVYLAKGVALGPHLYGRSNPQQGLTAPVPNPNLFAYQDTRTPWCRIWIDWPSAQPARGSWNYDYLAFIEAQIAAAKSIGLAVMLTSYRFPLWVNGMEGKNPDTESLYDRVPKNDQTADPKPLEFRYPNDVSTTSDFAFWVYVLAARYHPVTRPLGPNVWIDALEICNEPNAQWWPQRDPSVTSDPWATSGDLRAHRWTAKMIATAREITRSYTGDKPLLVAPAVLDSKGSSRLRTDYFEFSIAVLNRLDELGFRADSNIVWSAHNYADVTYNLGSGSVLTDANRYQDYLVNRARVIRALLKSTDGAFGQRWPGWPAAGNPYVFLTEGGVTMQSLSSKYGYTGTAAEQAQGQLLLANYRRMNTDGVGSDGEGIGMVMNYLWYSSLTFDSGLIAPDGTVRGAYYYWKCLPC